MSSTRTLGQARITRRRTPTFPFRLASYWDLTPWQGGYIRLTAAPGAVHLGQGRMACLTTGAVYLDSRSAGEA